MRARNFIALIAGGAALILCVSIPWIETKGGTGGYLTQVSTLLLIYMTMAVAWNLIGGYGGQYSLGHAAFFGVGAYTGGLLRTVGLGMPEAILIGGVSAAIIALPTIPTFKLRGVYFCVATLFLDQGLLYLYTSMTPITGGGNGLYFKPLLYSTSVFFYASLALVVAAMLTTRFVLRSRIGLALRAIRDEEEAAQSLGINASLYKSYALLLSAFFFGLTGGLYMATQVFIDPPIAFSLGWSFDPIFMAIIGGAGTLVGPIIGTIIVSIVDQIAIGYGTASALINGVLFVGMMVIAPHGVYGVIRQLIVSGRERKWTRSPC